MGFVDTADSKRNETNRNGKGRAFSGRLRGWGRARRGVGGACSARLSMTEKIALPCFALILLGALLAYGSVFSGWATFEGRSLNKNLPWHGASLTVDRADCRWMASGGDARKALRAAWYPSLRLRASGSEGSLLVRFSDARGKFAGDAVNLQLTEGRLTTRDAVNAACEGNEATVNCEAGFSSGDDFRHHVLQETEPYWTASVWERLADGSLRLLGRVTVNP